MTWSPLLNPLWGPRRPGWRVHHADRARRARRRASALAQAPAGRMASPVHPVPTPGACPPSVMDTRAFLLHVTRSIARGNSSGRKAEEGERCLYFQATASALPRAFRVVSQSPLDPSLLIGLSVCLSPTHTPLSAFREGPPRDGPSPALLAKSPFSSESGSPGRKSPSRSPQSPPSGLPAAAAISVGDERREEMRRNRSARQPDGPSAALPPGPSRVWPGQGGDSGSGS